MKITFYAHASFRLEADGIALITDPYRPGRSGFDPIDEPADVVLMSSATDDFHSDPSHIRGEPIVINTLELPPEGAVVRDIPVRASRLTRAEPSTTKPSPAATPMPTRSTTSRWAACASSTWATSATP